MKIAISLWNGRVSPVFDVARQVVVMDAKAGKITGRREHDLATYTPAAKVAKLVELGVDVLICGAVSRPLAAIIAARGIKLIPFVAGASEQVAAAYLEGSLPGASFAMPGCFGRRRGFWGRGGRRGTGACFGGRYAFM